MRSFEISQRVNLIIQNYAKKTKTLALAIQAKVFVFLFNKAHFQKYLLSLLSH
jgi:hypothetical protein